MVQSAAFIVCSPNSYTEQVIPGSPFVKLYQCRYVFLKIQNTLNAEYPWPKSQISDFGFFDEGWSATEVCVRYFKMHKIGKLGKPLGPSILDKENSIHSLRLDLC